MGQPVQHRRNILLPVVFGFWFLVCLIARFFLASSVVFQHQCLSFTIGYYFGPPHEISTVTVGHQAFWKSEVCVNK